MAPHSRVCGVPFLHGRADEVPCRSRLASILLV
jgi:hypothetical protein